MRKVFCPQCKSETLFSPENPFRPFCSERCRLIDLGEWASESYRVVVTKNPHEDDTSEEAQDLLQMPDSTSRRDSEDPS